MDDEIECFAVGDDQIVGNVIEFGKSVALGFLEGHRPALQGIDTSLWREYKGRNGSAAEKDRGEKGFLDPVAGKRRTKALLFGIGSHGFHGGKPQARG